MISVLLSAYNESENPYFWQTLDLIERLQSRGLAVEVLVGLTIGHDDTLEKLTSKGIKTIVVQTKRRGERYNIVLRECSSTKDDWILLHHPRSLLQEEAFLALNEVHKTIKWGAFTHQFDHSHPLLSFTSWWSNFVRGDIKNIFYLDHCLFVRRDLFELVGGVPLLEIFEDTVLSRRLAAVSRPLRLNWKSTTSAIRFIKKGLWQQSIENQSLKLRFLLGVGDKSMNESYERDINLNN